MNQKNKRGLAIIWPQRTPADIQEVRFSYDFCRRMTRSLLLSEIPDIAWIDYSADQTLGPVLEQTAAEMLLVVTDPEVLLSPSGVRRLMHSASNGIRMWGPVYNVTAYPDQQANLPVPYLNVSSFLDLSRMLAEREDHQKKTIAILDPACVLYRREILVRAVPEVLLSDMHQSLQTIGDSESAAVDTGALVHSFGDYYGAERDDLVRLVPPGVQRILDVGCARGGYGKRLRQMRPDVYLTGVEMNPLMAEAAGVHYDEVFTSTVEDADLTGDFELINCGDILEHLYDPWNMLQVFYRLLKPGGFLVTSIPNAGHWTIVKDLLEGKFQYIPVGLICMSHIRWFTESSICQALEDAGFQIDILEREQLPPTSEGLQFIEKMCAEGYGNEMSLKTNEFIIRAIKK